MSKKTVSRGQISRLDLVYPPISNQEAVWLEGDLEAQEELRASDFYMIAARPEAKFTDIEIDEETHIVSRAREILCMTKRPLVAEMRPWLTAMPILITPQWPLVVTRAMFQLPSNGAAAAGEAEAKITKAVERAKAYMRLPIMRVLMRVLYPEPISVRLLTVPSREIYRVRYLAESAGKIIPAFRDA